MEKERRWKYVNKSGSGAVYGLGFLGALVYFIQHAHTFLGFIIGFLESIVWPAVLVYKAFELLKL